MERGQNQTATRHCRSVKSTLTKVSGKEKAIFPKLLKIPKTNILMIGVSRRRRYCRVDFRMNVELNPTAE